VTEERTIETLGSEPVPWLRPSIYDGSAVRAALRLRLPEGSTKTTVIARRLKRSVGAAYQQASKLGVSLGAPTKKRRA
jgi:hypothetical protein